MATLVEDFLSVRTQLEADIRDAWQFQAGDKIYFVPMEQEQGAQRYAMCIRESHTEEIESPALRRHTITYRIVGSFKRQGGEDRDAKLLEKWASLRDRLNANQGHYVADVVTMAYVTGVENYLSEGTDLWDRLSVTFEVIILTTPTDA